MRGIKKSRRGLRGKLADRRGFTLSEMLVVLAIMSLVGAAIGVGITAAARAYRDVTDAAEALSLCGTISTELADELRFARDVKVVGGSGEDAELVKTITSANYGPDAAVVVDESGQLTLGGKPLLSQTVYMGMEAKLTLTYADGVFGVTITIHRPDESQLASSEFSVRALNG
ncbi:MAG: type II secretion system GspH family protein [Oscillospiraceae bacterium]|jgi:prepilin-type N-terminal cleavage/methylation domain-containing protein|nr:type II secretion system GspH family protein [Oscillospiraceae bacterium]